MMNENGLTPHRKVSENGKNSPRATLGILGGGQLAKMIAEAARRLNCKTIVLETTARCPAAGAADRVFEGSWNDFAVLKKFSALCDAVTLENEFVDVPALAFLEKQGAVLRPPSACVRIVQDKLLQKKALAGAGLPVPRFCQVSTLRQALAKAATWGWPVILKRRRNAYDGKGNATVSSGPDMRQAWSRLQGKKQTLYLEEHCDFKKELAVIVTRGQDGSFVTYPVVETIQRDHICHTVIAPASVAPGIAARVGRLAREAVRAIGGVGSMGVEFFLMAGGKLLINEISPRVHNSGHYTIEACRCSQFENHVRAVFGWPLGSPAMRTPAAVMMNLLGQGTGDGRPRILDKAPSPKTTYVHIYGKTQTAKGRKMGHVTALGSSWPAALKTAQRVADTIRFGQASSQ